MCDVVLTTKQGQEKGQGVLEQLVIGPAPSGFAGMMDFASYDIALTQVPAGRLIFGKRLPAVIVEAFYRRLMSIWIDRLYAAYSAIDL